MKRMLSYAVLMCVAVGLTLWPGCSKKSKATNEAADQDSSDPAAVAHARARDYSSHRPTSWGGPKVSSRPTTMPGAVAGRQTSMPDIPTPEGMSPQAAKMFVQFGTQVLDVVALGDVIEVQFMLPVPDRAATVLTPANDRFLIDQKSGTKLKAITNSRTKGLRVVFGASASARKYFASFYNPNGQVKPGDKVAFVADEFRIDDLVVK